MYISHDVIYRIFSVELVVKEAVSTDLELFKAITARLFEHKVITTINIDNVEHYTVDGKLLSRFDIHLCNTHNPALVRLTSVTKALEGLVDDQENYSELKVTLN